MISLQNITPPKPSEHVFGIGADAFFALMTLVGDPQAASKRLLELIEAATAANDAIQTANEAEQRMKDARTQHDKQLAKERAEHDRLITADRAKFDSWCAHEMTDVRSRLENATKLEAKAKADAAAAATAKAECEGRLDKIKQAAA